MALLEIRNVEKSYGKYPVLHGISLDIESGEFITFLGPSGCGKSTLLKIIAGFEDANGGDILLNGQSILDVPSYRRPLTMMFQSLALFPHLTVRENVEFGLMIRKVARAVRRRESDAILDLVGIRGLADKRVTELSGGQQQRVALARALMIKPKLLLLDEPLSALDAKLRQQLQKELKQIQTTTKCTFIFVTHDQEEAMSLSDRIIIMNGGRIEQQGAPMDIYRRPATEFAAKFLGEVNSLPLEMLTRLDPEFAIPSGTTSCFIRPEDVRLSPAKPSKGISLEGVIQNFYLTNGFIRCEIKTEIGNISAFFHARTGSREVKNGDPVWATLDPNDFVMLN